jgi:ankyrin repeat protein
MNIISSSVNKNQKLKSMSIDENIYLLALVCTSNLEALKTVLIKNQMKFDVNFNFVFKVPVQADSTNIVEEVSELVELNQYYSCVDDYMRKNKLMKRLFCYYNIEKLDSKLMMGDNDISASFDSGIGSYENVIGVKKNESEKDLIELVNDSIANNKFYELTSLNIAIFLENYDCIRFILRNSAGLGPMKPNQINSLHLALYQNNNTILSMLLSQLSCEEIDSGVIHQLSDDRGYNPIQIAVYYGNEEALSLLQSHGVDFNFNESSSTQILIWALESIDIPIKIIECLLSLGSNPNCIDKTHGYSPLMVAVLADRKDLVELLIKHDADVNKTIDNPSACCALQIAIDRISQVNSYEIVEKLLSSGANPTFYQRIDENGLQVRNFGGPLIDAIANNSVYLVEKLLSFGANANTDVNGTFSPICTACFLGRLEIVEVLIKNNVDPLLKCKNSNTPLTIACSMVFKLFYLNYSLY